MKIVRLRKSLIISSLIFTMLFMVIGQIALPVVAVASEVVTTDDDSDEIINTEAINIGVSRSDTLETNQEIFSETVLKIAKIFFGFVVFVVIVLTGITAITNCYDGKTRAQIIEKFKHIIYGVLLFALATTIVAVAVNFQETLIEDLYDVEFLDVSTPVEVDDTLDSNWLANILELAFKIIGRVLEWLIHLLFNIISGNLTADTTQYNLNNILFLADFGDVIDLSATNAAGQTLTTAPFTVEQWDRYTKAYFFLSAVAMPIMLIAIIKAAYDMIINAGNFEKAMEVKKTVMRMVAGIIIVAAGPYLFRAVLTFFNMMVYLIPVEFTFDIVIEDIDDANGLLAVITSFWWIWIKFKIMLMFTVRQIMLTVMYIVTPVVIGFWTLSEKTKAFNKWIGETITNAAAQFCYAMVFFIATIVLSGAQTNAFFTLLWLSMMMKLAEFFREMFQNLFDKWSGINELGEAEKMLGTASKVAGGTVMTASAIADPNMNWGITRAINNAHNIKTGLTTGKWSPIITKESVLKAKLKDDMSGQLDDISTAEKALRASNPSLFDDYHKDYQSAMSTLKSTNMYGDKVNGLLSGIALFNKDDASWSDTRYKKERQNYYRDQVQNALQANGYKMDFNTQENRQLLDNLTKRAMAYGTIETVSQKGTEGFIGAENEIFDMYEDYRKMSIDKRATKAAYDDTFTASIQKTGKIHAKGLQKDVTAQYVSQNPIYAEHVPEQVTIQSNPNLISIPSGQGTNSYVSVPDDYVKSLLESRGATNVTPEQLARERSDVENRISANLSHANKSIETQDKAKAGLPDAVKQTLSQGVINDSVKALDSTIELYRKSGAQADAAMVKQLQEYADALGYNGEAKLKESYTKAIKEISKK